MIKSVIYVAIAAAFFTAGISDASAQKYPERRTTRQGTKLYYGGDFEAAETEYRRALEMEPSLREATFNLGGALFRQQKNEEAAKVYTAIAADSTATPGIVSAAGFNLGNTMLATGEIDKAIESYKQALRIKPDDMQAKYNLAYAQKLKQQQEQNQDENRDENQDQGGQGQDDRSENGQNGDQNLNQSGEDRNNEDQKEEPQRDGNDDKSPPTEQNSQGGEAAISPEDASHMLDAIQDAEDKTREKMNAKEVPAVGRSGKNW